MTSCGSEGWVHGLSVMCAGIGPTVFVSAPLKGLKPWSQVFAIQSPTILIAAFCALAAKFPDKARDQLSHVEKKLDKKRWIP